jgi:hypothetical protein
MQRLSIAVVALLGVLPSCSASTTLDGDSGIDAAPSADAGRDASSIDAARADAPTAIDAGEDAFVALDAGSDAAVVGDAGTDAFVMADGGHDAGEDAFEVIVCTAPFVACDGACVNTDNDILNCGSCGNTCAGAHPYCAGGSCVTAPCSGAACGGSMWCCGTSCCAPGELCCDVPGPIDRGPQCTTPVGGTCPMGCPLCVCASPDTPIATPSGERRIADLGVGDLVYSADDGMLRAVPIAAVHQTPVSDHRVVRVELETGRVLEISPGHPTADGRWFGDLRPGDRLDGVLVVSAELVPYVHAFTYDILPSSDTGTYVAGGALIGSTLSPADAPIASIAQ